MIKPEWSMLLSKYFAVSKQEQNGTLAAYSMGGFGQSHDADFNKKPGSYELVKKIEITCDLPQGTVPYDDWLQNHLKSASDDGRKTIYCISIAPRDAEHPFLATKLSNLEEAYIRVKKFESNTIFVVETGLDVKAKMMEAAK